MKAWYQLPKCGVDACAAMSGSLGSAAPKLGCSESYRVFVLDMHGYILVLYKSYMIELYVE